MRLCTEYFVQVHPLKPIQNGGGKCSPTAPKKESLPQSCGGISHGVCQSQTKPPSCECTGNWTGPHCLNPMGFDDVIWDPPETLADLGFTGPSLKASMGIAFIVAILAGILLMAPVVLKKRKSKQRRRGYERVGNGPDNAPDYERRV